MQIVLIHKDWSSWADMQVDRLSGMNVGRDWILQCGHDLSSSGLHANQYQDLNSISLNVLIPLFHLLNADVIPHSNRGKEICSFYKQGEEDLYTYFRWKKDIYVWQLYFL